MGTRTTSHFGWQAGLVMGMCAALVGGGAARSLAAAPVQATVQTITHKMITAEYDPDKGMYPMPAPKAERDAIQAAMKARKTVVEQAYAAAHPAEAAAARDARTAWSKLAPGQHATAEAQALQRTFQAYDTAVAAVQETDADLVRLNTDMQKLTDSVRQRIDYTCPLVTLNNGLIEVKIVPTLGMRILNAVDLQSGQALCGTPDPRAEETADFSDVIAWDAGWTEASYPYFEHGVGVRQPAGYRVINNPDGSVTVAMDMRFTEHQDPRHMQRYGRYSPRTLSEWVTLRPGENRYTVTYRLDNPLPVREGCRLWVNHRMWAEKYDGEHIIYPAGYIMPHGGQTVSPFYADGGQRQWVSISHFALYTDYQFCGVYSPKTDTNGLIITNPPVAPGMKLYTTNKGGGFLELWSGSGVVFEDPGHFVGEYEPVQFTYTYYAVHGAGRVQFANADVAIAQKDGRYTLTSTRAATAEVTDGAGQVLGKGAVAPGQPLSLTAAKRMVVTLDGKRVADVAFPLTYTDTTARLAEVKPLGGKFRLELEENSNHVGAPVGRDAIPVAQKLVKAGTVEDAEYALSIARTVYRHGHLDLARDLLKLIPAGPDADYLKGLIAWEKGEAVDFGTAGVEANYHRAMLALQQQDTAGAVKLLDALIAARPQAYYPRLMRAYLARDRAQAQTLAAENPASPEAQLVLELLGVKEAKTAKDALLKDNPDAPEQVDLFKAQITEGKWQFVRRYAPTLPK